MTEASSKNRWLGAALVGAGLAVAVWFVMAPGPAPLQAGSGVADVVVEDSSPPPSFASTPKGSGVSPDFHITEGGRLSIEEELLRQLEVLTLGLELPDEARGSAPLAVRIVSVDGRTLDVTTQSADTSGSGVQISVAADWLRPGGYMIQIKTAEKTALPLRRYVLEVR